jgi:hypothetical protein
MVAVAVEFGFTKSQDMFLGRDKKAVLDQSALPFAGSIPKRALFFIFTMI